MKRARYGVFTQLALFFVRLLTTASDGFALDASKHVHQYRHTIFRRADGLAANAVRSLAQTPDGYLWIASTGGLTSFDGVRFVTRFSASGASQTYADRTGLLWAAASYRALRLQNNAPTIFGVEQGIDPSKTRYLSFANTSDGRFWAVSTEGLRQFTGDRFEPVATQPALPHTAVSKVIGGLKKDIWIGYSGAGVAHVEGQNVRMYGLANGLPNLAIIAMSLGPDGTFWLATPTSVGRLSSDGSYLPLSFAPKEELKALTCLLVDRQGAVWIGSDNGLFRIVNGRVEHFGETDGLSSNEVVEVFEDSEANVWVGTHDGLDRFSDVDLTLWNKRDGLPYKSVREVCTDVAGVIHAIGYHQPVPVIFREGAFVADPAAAGLPASDALACPQRQPGVWIAAHGKGAYLLDNETIQRHVTWPGSETDLVRSLAEAQDGTLWIGTVEHGLKLVTSSGDARVLDSKSLPGLDIGAIYPAQDGKVWIGTTRGAAVIKPGSDRAVTLSGTDKIASIIGFLPGQHGMWISGASGLIHAGWDDKLTLMPVQRLGLLAVYNVREDNLGHFWIVGSRGLIRVGQQDLDRWIGNQRDEIPYRPLGPLDGQMGDYFSSNCSISKDSQGRLWFATSAGLLSIEPDHLSNRSPEAPVLIEGIDIDSRPALFQPNLTVPATADRLAIRWTQAKLTRPEAVKFNYQLIGFDKSSVSAGNTRVATYTNIPPGTYAFQIKADYYGIRTQLSSPLVITKKARFYQTLWFQLLCFGLALLVLWSLHYLRLKQLRYQHGLVMEERSRIARELHDTLLQGFSGLLLSLRGTAPQLEASTPVRKKLEEALDYAAIQLRDARRAVWDLRATALEQSTLPQAIAEMLKIHNGNFSLKGVGRPISAQAEGALLRFTEEALANVRQHSNASQIDVALFYGDERLHLSVSDNGIGFDPASISARASQHFGIEAMRERIEKAGGAFTLRTAPGAGTEVRAELPSAAYKRTAKNGN